MEQNHKQNFSKRSEMMSKIESIRSKSPSRGEESNVASITQWKSVSSGGGVSNSSQYKSVSSEEGIINNNSTQRESQSENNYYGCQVSGGHTSSVQSQREQKAIANEKSHGIRGFLKLLPFMPRFIRKTLSSKQNNAQKQTSLSRIRICPSSSLEENDVHKLIRLYQSYENLYNPNHPDFGNSKREDICYSRIAYSFPKKTSQELQNLLYELRALFEREYTIIENGERRLGQILLPTIKYYNEFLFLVPFLNIKWDSGVSLPPSIPLLEEAISDNGCTSDGTDRSRSSVEKLKEIDASDEREDEKESSLEEQSEQVDIQILNSQLKTIPNNLAESNIMRPSAGLNMMNAYSTPVYGNQFMCFGKKKSKGKQSEKPLKDQLDTVQPEATHELDPKDAQNAKRLSEQAQPLSEDEWKDEEQLSRQKLPISQELDPKDDQTAKQLSEHAQPLSQDDQTAKRLSGQLEPLSQERTSHSEVFPPENHNLLTETHNKDIPLPSQKRLSGSPCQGKGDREPCLAYCNPVWQQRPNTSENPLAETFTTNNPARISNQTNPGNQEQLQMLCDMIKMELGSSPDFIYYDAKWRIIEILREVQKRNLIHAKSNPENNGTLSKMPKNCNCIMNAVSRNREESANVAQRNRIRAPMKGTQCPYCYRR